MTRPILSDDDIWTLMAEGCNAAEIAAYAGIEKATAVAWMVHARSRFVRAAA